MGSGSETISVRPQEVRPAAGECMKDKLLPAVDSLSSSSHAQLTGIWRGGRPLSMGNARGQQQDLRPLMLRDIRKQYTFRLRDGAVELSEPGSAGMSSLVL